MGLGLGLVLGWSVGHRRRALAHSWRQSLHLVRVRLRLRLQVHVRFKVRVRVRVKVRVRVRVREAPPVELHEAAIVRDEPILQG